MIQSGLICAFVWLLVQGMDRMLSWQTLQRPIVTATLTGLLLGDLHTGIVMAASLEAIFMGISAIGGSIPSDACSSSIIAVAYTILTGADVETGLALAMPIGTLMGTANEMWKPVLAAFAPYWERLAGSGNVKSFRAQVIASGWILDRLPQTIVLFAAITFGVQGLEHVMNNMPAFIMAGHLGNGRACQGTAGKGRCSTNRCYDPVKFHDSISPLLMIPIILIIAVRALNSLQRT